MIQLRQSSVADRSNEFHAFDSQSEARGIQVTEAIVSLFQNFLKRWVGGKRTFISPVRIEYATNDDKGSSVLVQHFGQTFPTTRAENGVADRAGKYSHVSLRSCLATRVRKVG
jgi:hypothetical protein